jgi:adenylate cyclase
VSTLPGRSILEPLRIAGVPHASVCGGRGRCTTCRVRVGADHLSEPSELERGALARIDAPPGVRLACQARPEANIQVTALLPASARDARSPGGVSGTERVVTTMFLDLRGSTKLGERKLPYDVLFILNQFFAEMAEALGETRGHYAQFAGDGLMALYGLRGDSADGARDAFRGAAVMLARLDSLNDRLGAELDAPLIVGIGIHTGEAIVGTMGSPASPNHSAIGDNINIATRLEAKTKEFGCAVVAAVAAMQMAGMELEGLEQYNVEVRGRDAGMDVITLDQASLEARLTLSQAA